MILRIFQKKRSEENFSWSRTITSNGIIVNRGHDTSNYIEDDVLGYLTQLVDDSLAEQNEDQIIIEWASFYQALISGDYDGLETLLRLPQFTNKNPVLRSSNSLTDHNFSISLSGWRDLNGNTRAYSIEGGVITSAESSELMKPGQWFLVNEIISFSRRGDEQRNELDNRKSWGKIRGLAVQAGAQLDDFLKRTVVLTPDRLNILLRKSKVVADDTVIEIEPTFDGAPPNWLERFDGTREVPNRYDIVTDEGIIQVIITPEIKTVLKEIKRLDSRRVAGSRAQAFIVNPYATLGEDAKNVIIEDQFIQAKHDAGIICERFIPVIEPDKIGLLIESSDYNGPIRSDIHWLSNDEIRKFIQKLEAAINQSFQLLAWNGYDLEILGDAQDHIQLLHQALNNRSEKQIIVSHSDIHDLSSYSPRIEGIGIEKPVKSPHITKKDEQEGWFPKEIILVGDDQPTTKGEFEQRIQKLNKLIDDAEISGEDSIKADWMENPISVTDAKRLKNAYTDAASQNQPPINSEDVDQLDKKSSAKQRATLILRSNIENLDFDEFRRKALNSREVEPEIPASLNPKFPLLPHQKQGLSWLQHLFASKSEYNVRGAVLADDMGLGKTFQVLAFMGWLVERNADINPMLIVAPVSLLENWKEEAKKFILTTNMPMLTAYGDNLSSLRVPRDLIDERLRKEDGLVRFLKPDWIGQAKVVLTEVAPVVWTVPRGF